MPTAETRGFTLIELLVAMAVSLTVLGAVCSLFILAQRSYSSENAVADIQQKVRATLEIMSRQIANLYWMTRLDCSPESGSIKFLYIEDAGTPTGAQQDSITDTSKSWDTDKWKNGRVIILDGPGSQSDQGLSTGNNDAALLNDTDKSWPVGKWQGFDIVLTGGTGYGQIRGVRSNTASQLTVSPDWDVVPDTTSQYEIRQVRTIVANTSHHLSVHPGWIQNPDNTSLYCILRLRGFSRDPEKNQIKYTVGAGTQTFAEDVTALTLEGYDEAGMFTCDPAHMTRLETTLTGRTPQPDPMNKRYRYYTVKTAIRLDR